jgi:tetratricopeptide (TPR) repeat protein
MTVAAGNARPTAPSAAASNEFDAALIALRQAAAREPRRAQIWRQLADHLDVAGDRNGAAAAYLEHVRQAVHDPLLMRAAAAVHANRIAEAEALLREQLKRAPTDVVAIRMLAEIAVRIDRAEDAENLLERCLELAPGFRQARHNYAIVLARVNKPEQAIEELDRLLTDEPAHPAYRNLKAVALCHTGDYEQAIGIFDELLRATPGAAPIWLSLGHALKTAGHTDRCIAAYLKCVQLDATFGDAWWSLANLKTFRFDAAQLTQMQATLGRTDVRPEQRTCLEFAVAKALEDGAQYAESFAHYERGNTLRLEQIPYCADDTSVILQRARETYSAEFFRARVGSGCDAADPIFIVGLPRAGSTLVEQILASHSAVEGTMELPDILSITRALRRAASDKRAGAYHAALAQLDREALRELGEQYLARTRIHRKLGRPFFVDKMPNNFAHIGLIHLILPNAKIIDVRRHPLACCFSGFKQHFARGQSFTYGLRNIGRYYRDYVELMAHFDAVLPGRVHRVIYEDLVVDTQSQVHGLLAYCGLPFEESCLRFFDNARPVRTASSEQVRQPIYTGGLDHWQHFDSWLEPLKEALGPALTGWRGNNQL